MAARDPTPRTGALAAAFGLVTCLQAAPAQGILVPQAPHAPDPRSPVLGQVLAAAAEVEGIGFTHTVLPVGQSLCASFYPAPSCAVFFAGAAEITLRYPDPGSSHNDTFLALILPPGMQKVHAGDDPLFAWGQVLGDGVVGLERPLPGGAFVEQWRGALPEGYTCQLDARGFNSLPDCVAPEAVPPIISGPSSLWLCAAGLAGLGATRRPRPPALEV